MSSLWPYSVVVQPGLCQTWSETPKTGFLRTRLNWAIMPSEDSYRPDQNSFACRSVTENVPMDSKDFSDWAYTLADQKRHRLAQTSELLVVSRCCYNDNMPMQCTAIFHDGIIGTLHTCYF